MNYAIIDALILVKKGRISLKIIHTADWHLGKSIENISRLEEQESFIEELCILCDDEKADLVLVAGDVFDSYRPSAKAEELFFKALERLCKDGQRAVVVIAGNHDNPDRLSAAATLIQKSGIFIAGQPGEDLSKKFQIRAGEANIHRVRLVNAGEGFLEISVPGVEEHAVVVVLPYPSESRLKEVLSETAEEQKLQKAYSDRVHALLAAYGKNFRKDTVNVVVSHLFILGGKESDSERTLSVGGAYTVRAEHLPHNADYIALGHLHRPQKIKTAPSLTYYAGSPLAYSFSESGYAKNTYVLEIKPSEEVQVSERLLRSGKPLARWKVQSMEEALAWAIEGKDAHAWVDVEVKTNTILLESDQRELRRIHPGIMNIRPIIHKVDHEPERLVQREGRKIEDLFTEFYKQKRQGIEPRNEVLEMLVELLQVEGDDES